MSDEGASAATNLAPDLEELDRMAPAQPDVCVISLASAGAAARIPPSLPTPERRSDLPRMSWVCSVDESGTALLIGPDVEELPDGIFEGVWDGAFDRRDPQRAEHLFGSGVMGTGRGLLILTPKHTLEGVFVLEHKRTRRLYISNSLACVCCVAGIRVSEEVVSRAKTVKHGFYKFDPRLLENDEIVLHKLLFYNYSLQRDGMARRMALSQVRKFESYEDYRASVLAVIEAVVTNARDSARRRSYEPVATISAGYDSPAVAALAKEAGCQRAITVRIGRRGRVDSGRQVAKALGLELVERDRPPFPELEDPATNAGLADLTDPVHFKLAAEFLAAGMIGHEAVFAPFADVLPGALLFTGFQGDKYWDISGRPSTDAERTDTSGSSMFEFRSRLGFVHLPVPFIFIRSQETVWDLGKSDEMKPYSVGGAYDRPIARRLAEDAGVPRAAFGQRKNASAVLFSGKQLFSRSVDLVSRRYRPVEEVLAARRRIEQTRSLDASPRRRAEGPPARKGPRA